MSVAARWLLIVACAFAAWDAPAQDAGRDSGAPSLASRHFRAGSEAFEAQDYRSALSQFRAAIAAGSDGPAAHYNVAVCHYLLGEYELADAAFRALARDFPQMRAIADYNVGLTHVRRNQNAQARIEFERAAAADDDRIAALANAMLARLPDLPDGSSADRWTTLLDLSVGHDDNVALVDPLVLPSGSSPESAFSEMLLYVGGAPSPGGSWRLDASLFLLIYADADDFNQQGLYVRARRELVFGDWTLSAGPHVGRTALGGDGFDRSLGASAELSRSLAGSRAWVGLELVHDDYDALSSRFRFIDGTRRQAAVSLGAALSSGRFSAEYRRIDDDRAGAGVSADRDRWSLRYRRAFGASWTAEIRYQKRDSDYDRLSVPRVESRDRIGLQTTRRIASDWRLEMLFQYTDNDSSDEQFGFQRRLISVGATRLF